MRTDDFEPVCPEPTSQGVLSILNPEKKIIRMPYTCRGKSWTNRRHLKASGVFEAYSHNWAYIINSFLKFDRHLLHPAIA